MIIKWLSELHGPTGFLAEPEDYDGTPRISHLWIDSAPKNRHWDRQAIAAYLVFGDSFGGPVSMPHKFSPAVATAIKAAAKPVQLDIQPIEYYPKALPIGERKLRIVSNETVPEQLLKPNNQEVAFLEILRSDQASGAIRRVNGITVASNAWLHTVASGNKGWFPLIAIACLFAEDLDAGTIVLPPSAELHANERRILEYLLGTARLGLEIEEL
ncbi:hypothetical protein [Glutamicibacter uratoxydans]|uniref:hypothetical protein n=1 Tax=Glutamicibacter uratoxydans TaxID=43667 RepID=UPI003D6F799C